MKKIIFGVFLALALVLPACTSGQASELCGCGFEKGTEQCCDESAARCGSCDKIKDSPGCCVE